MIKLLLTIASLMLANDFAHAEDVSYDSDSSLSDSSDTSVGENTNDKKKGKSSKAVGSTQVPSKNPFAWKSAGAIAQAKGSEVTRHGNSETLAQKIRSSEVSQIADGPVKRMQSELSDRPVKRIRIAEINQLSNTHTNKNAIRSVSDTSLNQKVNMAINQSFKKNAYNTLNKEHANNNLAPANKETGLVRAPKVESRIALATAKPVVTAPVVVAVPSGSKTSFVKKEAKKTAKKEEKKTAKKEAKKQAAEEAAKKKAAEEAKRQAADLRDKVLSETIITSNSGSNKVSTKDAKERVQKRISDRENAVLSKIKESNGTYPKMANFVLDNLNVGKFGKLSVKEQNKVIAIAQLILAHDPNMKVTTTQESKGGKGKKRGSSKEFSGLVETKLTTLQDGGWIKIKDGKTVSDKLSNLLDSAAYQRGYSGIGGYYDSYGNGTRVASNEEWRYFGSALLTTDEILSADQNFKNLLAVVDDKMLIRSSSEEKIVEQAKLKSIHEQEKERRVSKYKDLVNAELDKAGKAAKKDIKELRGYGLEAMLLHSDKIVGNNKCELSKSHQYYDEMKRLTGKDKPTLHDLYEAVQKLNHERELGVIHGHNEHLMEGYDALYQKVAEVLHDTITEYNSASGRTQISFENEKIAASCTEVRSHTDELSNETLADGVEKHTSLSAFLEASTSLVRVGGQEQAKAFVEAAFRTKDHSIIAHAISMLDDKTFGAINKLWKDYADRNKGGLTSYGGTFEGFMKEHYDEVVRVLEDSDVKFHDTFTKGKDGEENLKDMIEQTREKNYLEHGINAYEHSNLETFRNNTRKKTTEEKK